MEAGARIGHGTVCKGLDLLHLEEEASIGRGNWITATPLDEKLHYRTEVQRSPNLLVEKHAAVTHRHLIDCTGGVRIGSFATLAGFRSQLLTHSIDIVEGRQKSASITIGSYTFVGTDCVLLPGSVLPDHCVLGAKSLLDKRFTATHTLYAGVPARPVNDIPADAAYFSRTEGFVP
jgi:UDP-3-O-[3-hydroxymyristoyl] glucosamine N-acyltransferase